MPPVRPSSILAHPEAGRLEPLRLGARCAERVGSSGAEAPPTRDSFATDDLRPGARRIGDLEMVLERVDHGDAATFDWSLRNCAESELQLESAVMGLRWRPPQPGPFRFLRHGWQSWSFNGVLDLDAAGAAPFPSGEWLRGMHCAVGAPPPDRSGWHESDIVSAVGQSGGGAVCLVGVLESGSGFGTVYLRPEAGGSAVAIEVEVRLEVLLAPGESRRIESLRVALGTDANPLLESFAELWGRSAGARRSASFQSGWCSWYHFFHDVDEEDLLRNLEALNRDRDELPVEVVQLDDGYQRAIGDWLETNPKFPRGLAPLAREIRAAGFTPGIWTAPFCAVPESRVFQSHRDWLLRNGEDLFLGLVHPMWTPSGAVHALDTTREPVLRHLESLYRTLVEMGFDYLKLDFLHAAAMRAVRRGAGEGAFLLGCGCPLGPAVGLVDGMRIGPDVAPSWGIDGPSAIPGLEPVLPSLESALRSILLRAWMHRRLWINDPDCLIARSQQSSLTREEVRTLATAIAVTGGMLVFSDDVDSLSPEGRGWIRETAALANRVDRAGPRGAARVEGLLEPAAVDRVVARLGPDALLALLNRTDSASDGSLSLGSLGLAAGDSPPLAELGSNPPDLGGDRLQVSLAAHDSGLYRLPGSRALAVFCDFDGTFSVQDVGSTLARERAADLRPSLWARWERGEITAWEYNMAVLDGLVIPEAELDRFLETIELDPGAAELVAWCERRAVPFRILSDGFDHNLDRLQRIHGVRFEYDSNRLRYRGDRWQIEPGHPDPGCWCGTGTCKSGRIAWYRAEHPTTLCVHVGNGRVSDLCGALAADLAFAKGSLASALEARGFAYEPFETLRDVVARLESLLGEASA
jgi:alpha-galactosidase